MQKPLPRHIWIGYLIAGIVIVEELVARPDPDATRILEVQIPALMLSVPGVLYWYYLIYRIHATLAEVTANAYPISPGKAVIFQLIPFVNLYWTFHWPARLAAFVNSSAGAPLMRKRRAALLILLGWTLFVVNPGLGLAVLFGAISLIERRVAAVLTSSAAERRSPESPWAQRRAAVQIALVASFGTAIGFVFFLDAKNFAASREKAFEFFLVALVMAVAFEPALERLQQCFAEHLQGKSAGRLNPVMSAESPPSWSGVPMMSGLFVTELLRDSIHDAITIFDPGGHGDPSKLTLILLMMLVPSGAITYAWARGATTDPSRAALRGGVTGCVSGLLFGQALRLLLTLHGHPEPLYALLWGGVGIAGGSVIDRGWFGRTNSGVALAIIATAVAGFILYPVLHVREIWWFAALARATGWGVALIIVYTPDNPVLTAQSRRLMPAQAKAS